MNRFVWLCAGAFLPLAALAGEAPGPDWAFLTPGPNAPEPPAAAAPASAPQPGIPAIVLQGKGQEVGACSACHTLSGAGKPENANLRGLDAAYFARQMEDFRSGARGGPHAAVMRTFASALSEEEIRELAEYYAGLTPIRWTRVVESETTPRTVITRTGERIRLEGGETEPLGPRIIEFAENPAALNQTAQPPFVAYVPPGSLQSGQEIAETGSGKTEACTGCHGPDLKGEGDIPALAGRSPVYIARQLYAFRNGLRTGPYPEIMKSIADPLSEDDMIGVAAYLASLDPA